MSSTITLTIYGEPASRITFIYALLDETGACRYVGKSDAPHLRFENHIRDAADTRKARWIRALASRGHRPTLLILQVVRFEDWQALERHWIGRYRAEGANLTNSTEGGRGPLQPGAETREKMRLAKLGGRLSAETRAKVSAALKGKPKPPRTTEHAAALASACMGRTISPEHRTKLAQANMHRAPQGASGFKGVYFDAERGKFQAHIKVAKRMVHLGRFGTDIEAARAYNTAARSLGWPEEGLNPV